MRIFCFDVCVRAVWGDGWTYVCFRILFVCIHILMEKLCVIGLSGIIWMRNQLLLPWKKSCESSKNTYKAIAYRTTSHLRSSLDLRFVFFSSMFARLCVYVTFDANFLILIAQLTYLELHEAYTFSKRHSFHFVVGSFILRFQFRFGHKEYMYTLYFVMWSLASIAYIYKIYVYLIHMGQKPAHIMNEPTIKSSAPPPLHNNNSNNKTKTHTHHGNMHK